MNSELIPWSPSGREWVVLFCSLGYFLTYGSSQLEAQGRPREAQPPTGCLIMWHWSQTEKLLWFIAVEDLFREADIEPNGKVKYDEFIQKITIPVRDYWMRRQESLPWAWTLRLMDFWKEECSFHLQGMANTARWPNHSKRTTRKQNDSSYGISMSLIKFFTVLTTTISLALYSLWFRDGPGV